MGVASGFNRGSDVVGGAAAELQMAIEVGEAFSCRLLSVTVGEGVLLSITITLPNPRI